MSEHQENSNQEQKNTVRTEWAETLIKNISPMIDKKDRRRLYFA